MKILVPAVLGLLTLAACGGPSPYEITAAKMGSTMPTVVAMPVQTLAMSSAP